MNFNENLYYTVDNHRTGESVRHSISVIKFPGGETNVDINSGSVSYQHLEANSATEVLLHARLKSGDDVMAMLLAKDAIERVYIHAKVSLFMPYIPYARQDRVCVAGEALSIKVFASLINSADFHNVIVTDAHSPTAVALINRCIAYDQFDVFAQIKQDWMNWTIVAPDMGAAKKCEDFAKRVGAEGVVYFNKARDLNTGKILSIDLIGEKPVDKNLLILDDICDGGRTFVGMLPALQGNKRIDLAVTHGIFSAGVDVLTSAFDTVYTTNSWSTQLHKLDQEVTGNLVVLKS